MKNFKYVALAFMFVVSTVVADEQDARVTLEQASKAAGLNAGAQQNWLNKGIDLNKFALGISEAYKTKLSEKRLQKAHEHLDASKKFLSKNSMDLGLVVASDCQNQLKKIDVSAFMEGFRVGYSQTVSSPELAKATLLIDNYYRQERLFGSEERLINSNKFLQENAKREGVVVTKSGLQYEMLEQGTGAKTTWMDMVQVNYCHTKPNSDFRYDSAEHGHSETMAMRGTIPEGWRELFLLMNKGARYRVYLPPDLGWGLEGNGDALLPNEVLITEFTLLDIIPPPPVVN
jgi:FKBP-type peptidyl-prolyl cis-trans isomerase FklB